ncbi:hypothetical protein Tco_1251352 [Tanacetum coccineum]
MYYSFLFDWGFNVDSRLYARKVVEDVGEDVDFNSGAWVSVTNYVNAFGCTVTGCLGDINNFLKKGKLEQVIAIVKSFLRMLLEIYGYVPGTYTTKVIDVRSFEKDIL